MVATAGKRAGVPFRVTPKTLAYTLRTIAIAHGFSYLGVVRSVGELHPTKSRRWVANADLAISQHGSIRLGQLIFNDPQSPLGMLAAAETLLNETDLPPAIAVLVAGTALERRLRMLAGQNEVQFRKPEDERTLNTYSTQLLGRGLLTRATHKRIEMVGQHRNDAAHGWFERVNVTTARSTLSVCRTVLSELDHAP